MEIALIICYLLFIFFAVFVMKKCSSSFDVASNFLTQNLGEGIKGPTINAIASSLPELFISSMFLFYYQNIEGFSAGFATIIGSSAFNIAVIPVISFLYIYRKKKKSEVFEINKLIIQQDTFFLLGSIVILLLGFFIGINLYLAVFLILFYFLYIFFLVKKRSKIKKDNLSTKINVYKKENTFLSSLLNLDLFSLFFKGKISKISSIFVIIISIFIIGFSCYWLVHWIELIAQKIGINLFFCAFIIAAIGSSVPDTILSMQDAKNNKFSDSFSNAYGSNIFDICIGIGLPVFVYSLIFSPIEINSFQRLDIGFLGNYVFEGNLFIWSLFSLFIFTVIVSYIYYKKNLKLNTSFQILILYILFVVSLILY